MVVAATVVCAGAWPRQLADRPANAPTLVIDLFALDREGRPERALIPGDLTVTIDGRPCRVVSVRPVVTGLGASASRTASVDAIPPGALAEPSRLVLVAVDESTVFRGREAALRDVVARTLDRLGGADRIAVATLPIVRSRIELSTDRSQARAAIDAVVGRAARPEMAATAGQDRPSDELSRSIDDTRGTSEAQTTQERQASFAAGVEQNTIDAATVAGNLTTPLEAMVRLLAGLRGAAGPKALILFVGDAWSSDPRMAGQTYDPRPEIPGVILEAGLARAVVHVVLSGGAAKDGVHRDLETMAAATGGTASRWNGKSSSLDRLASAMSARYLTELAADGIDMAAPHTVAATCGRPGVALLVPSKWTRRPDRDAEAKAAGPNSSLPIGTPQATTPAVAGSRDGDPPDAELRLLVARMVEYVAGYVKDFSNVVAEEDYYQRVYGSALQASPRAQSVHLRSDLLLVRTSGPGGWVPFRDVFEVDGKPVRDRESRLRKLFLETPDLAMAEARRITDEGARYNVGRISRSINLPTLPLVFLVPENVGGLRFSRKKDEVIGDARGTCLGFVETQRPTFVRGGSPDVNMPSSGTLCIDPLSGRILKTVLRNGDDVVFRVETIVTYGWDATLGLWAPVRMNELYSRFGNAENITGDATYRNFRRFQVKTEEQVKVPKDDDR